MSFTMEDFKRELGKKYFKQLSPQEQREEFDSLPANTRRKLLERLSAEERLAGLSPEQIQQYLDQLKAATPAAPRKPRRKK